MSRTYRVIRRRVKGKTDTTGTDQYSQHFDWEAYNAKQEIKRRERILALISTAINHWIQAGPPNVQSVLENVAMVWVTKYGEESLNMLTAGLDVLFDNMTNEDQCVVNIYECTRDFQIEKLATLFYEFAYGSWELDDLEPQIHIIARQNI